MPRPLLKKKPTDLDLHCLLRQGMSCLAREGLRHKQTMRYVQGQTMIHVQRYLIPLAIAQSEQVLHCPLPELWYGEGYIAK